jgi:hypothetical protein
VAKPAATLATMVAKPKSNPTHVRFTASLFSATEALIIYP